MSDQNSTLSKEEQFHQGAKVRRRYFIEPTRESALVSFDGTQFLRTEAYLLATSKPRKSWAKRYLKLRRYL